MLLQRDSEEKNYLIVGLGNPGAAYTRTRHNVGFRIVQAFADKYQGSFKHASHLMGDLAHVALHGKKLLLLLPTTFMNSSGDALRRCLDYYHVPLEQLMVVCDDVILPMGTMKIRPRGSSGGHNGLKSIAAHLNTEHYARLRIGVSAPGQEGLTEYVLGKFSEEENKKIDEIAGRAIEVFEIWITAGIASAMQTANKKLRGE